MRFTIDNLNKSEQLKHGKKIFKKLKINGRIPHDNIIILYVIAEMMGKECDAYLEIGVLNGGSMVMILQSQVTKRLHVGVDLFAPREKKGKGIANSDISLERSKRNVERYMNDHKIYLVKGNSHQAETVEKIKKHFKTGISLLFIDGDHSYEGVKKDFERYYELVRKGGFICFDDYGGPGHRATIRKFVDSIQSTKINRIGEFRARKDMKTSIFIAEKI